VIVLNPIKVMRTGSILPVLCCLAFAVFAMSALKPSGAGAGQLAAGPTGSGQDVPEALKAGYRERTQAGRRDWVLNSMNLGLDALQLGYVETAASLFDDALLGIETVYAHNEQAAKARGLWREEGSKDFKGEPYERAMAYYYRGLIDLMQGDIDNARASFRGGALQDAFAEEEQNRCDFSILVFLQGWCSQLLGDGGLMQPAYDEVGLLRKKFVTPGSNDNVLFIVELGTSPRKRTDGIGHAQLRFFRGRNFSEVYSEIELEDRTLACFPMESVFWQASTRGARPVDYVLEGKAHYREKAYEVGSAFANETTEDYGNFYAGSSAGTAANALGLVGGIFQLVSSKVKAKADARAWSNLPDSVHVATARLPEGSHKARVLFSDEAGIRLDELTKTLDITITAGSNVVWIRSRNQISCEPTFQGRK